MIRHPRNQKWVACWAFAACALFATSAAASEDGLVLLPDWTGKLPVLIVLFALLVYPVNAILLRPILRVLDAREERTAGTRSRAERIMGDAQETLANYEHEVREVRAEAEHARRQAASNARSENAVLVDAARAESEQHFARAQTELAAELEQSRRTLRGAAEALASEAAARVLGRAL